MNTLDFPNESAAWKCMSNSISSYIAFRITVLATVNAYAIMSLYMIFPSNTSLNMSCTAALFQVETSQKASGR